MLIAYIPFLEISKNGPCLRFSSTSNREASSITSEGGALTSTLMSLFTLLRACWEDGASFFSFSLLCYYWMKNVDFPFGGMHTERFLSLNFGCFELSLSASRALLLSLLDYSKLELGDVASFPLARFCTLSSLTSSSCLKGLSCYYGASYWKYSMSAAARWRGRISGRVY